MELAIIDGHRSGGGDQLPVAGMEGYQEEAEGDQEGEGWLQGQGQDDPKTGRRVRGDLKKGKGGIVHCQV